MFTRALLATGMAFIVMQWGYIRYFQIYYVDRQGTGSKIQMASGTPVAGHLVQFDGDGNVVDSGTAPGGSGVPTGLVGFFAGACPSGWSEYTAARGRYIVGVPSGGTVEGTVSTALGNLEVREVLPAHTHGFTLPDHTHNPPSETGTPGYAGYNDSYGYTTYSNGSPHKPPNRTWAATGYVTTPLPSGTTASASINAGTTPAPYIQLRACRKD